MFRVLGLAVLAMTLGAVTPMPGRAMTVDSVVEKASAAEDSCARRHRVGPGTRAIRHQMVQVVRPRHVRRARLAD